MKDGEVDLVTGWNGRFDVVPKDGAKVAYTFNQALRDYDCFGVPKGAPNKALAMKFLNEISKPQYQAEFTKCITYGPTNKKACDGPAISAAGAGTLPSHPDNAARQVLIDLHWYIKVNISTNVSPGARRASICRAASMIGPFMRMITDVR